MDGIVIVDKPQGFTSFDVVAKMRGIFKTKKIGHGGTLDPMATGVLPVFIGAAAKAVDLQPRQDKAYRAAVLFGQKTDTGDISGSILQQSEKIVDEQSFFDVLPRFVGEQEQLPPMYSAVKINGKPLYKYAREGKEIERKKRIINIISIENANKISDNTYEFDVHCSKGTYIRTLIEDIGEALGVPATMCALRRTQAGVFNLNDAKTLEEIQKARDEGVLNDLVLGIGTVFNELERLVLDEKSFFKLQNGAVAEVKGKNEGRYALYCRDGVFAGLGKVNAAGRLSAEKMFLRDL